VNASDRLHRILLILNCWASVFKYNVDCDLFFVYLPYW